MKRIVFTLLSLMLLTAATFKVSAQSSTTQTRQVSGFTGVASGGPFNVHIKIDGTESLKIEADADVINDIETVVENGTLNIRFKDHERNHHNIHKAEVYVTAKSLNSLIGAGSGSTTVDGTLSGDNVKVILSGSGDIRTSVKSEKLNTVISGSGSIKINGSANEAKIVVTGSGEVSGKDLKTQSLEAAITGSGSINVSANKTVSAHITGSGNVNYTGNANIVSLRTTGSGRVSKVD